MKASIYYHPRCKRSKFVLDHLKKQNIDTVVKDYMANGIARADIYDILELLDCKRNDIIRTEDATAVDKYCDHFASKESIINSIIKNPILMCRLIILFKEKGIAAITRTEESPTKLLRNIDEDTATTT